MLDQKRNLFRKESLERLSSPERLDQLMQVVSPKSWLPLATLASLVGVAIVWSIYGSIPITIEGKGVLIYPRKVVPLQSTSSGQLLTLNVKVGDVVKKGQILATIDQSELRKQLQQQKNKLKEIEGQNQEANLLQKQGIIQDKNTIKQQRQNAIAQIRNLEALSPVLKQKSRESIQKQRLQLQQRITELQALSPVLKQKSRESLQKQSQSLHQQIQTTKAQIPVFQKRTENLKRLFLEERAITQDVFLQAEQEYNKKLSEISQLETQLKELEVKESDTEERYINNQNEITRNRAELQKLELEETNAEEAYLKNQSEISKLRAELKDLDSKEASLAKQHLQDSTTRKNQIQELQRDITKLELQLRNNSEIISQQNGQVLELTVTRGQVVGTGTRLGSIDEENSSNKLVGITYFTIADGKKIQKGMKIQITPQTVKRERFGGIVGTISEVSPFPITKEAAASIVGNSEVVEGLVSQTQEGVVQVFADLKSANNFSGYKWSSSSDPHLKISPGTTATVRVKVEERAPITYVFPILRSLSGIY